MYCKLVELKWLYQNTRYSGSQNTRYSGSTLIYEGCLLGSLHISMCFLKTIGNHMNGSGLAETWVESALLGPNATEHALSGKVYKRAMCAHKLTAQALWRMLIPSIIRFCEKSNEDSCKENCGFAVGIRKPYPKN